jgi:hypothetical protein
VVLSLIRGAAESDRFWVQSFRDGSSGFIAPAGDCIIEFAPKCITFFLLAHSCGHFV